MKYGLNFLRMTKHYPDLKMQLKAEHLAVRLGTGSSKAVWKPTTPWIPRWSPNQVLTWPNVT